ncbi:MAG: hypothetical protein OXG79_12425 [Chloroflexi bacterium]|nr:hypothetical protein [Chloroflexota bacterium]
MIFGIDNVLLVLNGHTVEGGYSDDADAIMFEPIELVAEPRIGASGQAAYFRKSNRGGPFTLKFLPNAPSIPFFQQQAGIVHRGGSVVWNGSIRDTQRGISAQLRAGALRFYKPFPDYGFENVSNMEYPFYFAHIIPDFSTPTPGAFELVGAATS